MYKRQVVESRIDFVEDTLNEQGQAIAEKAPISHSSDKSTYGLGSLKRAEAGISLIRFKMELVPTVLQIR